MTAPSPETTVVATAVAEGGTPTEDAERETPLVEADLLVEDVSIDGMCGVY